MPNSKRVWKSANLSLQESFFVPIRPSHLETVANAAAAYAAPYPNVEDLPTPVSPTSKILFGHIVCRFAAAIRMALNPVADASALGR